MLQVLTETGIAISLGSVSEIDLLDLARSCGQTISGDFAQVITIIFAMVVAIYYFLHQAGIRMKLFAFAIYTCGCWPTWR